MKPLSHPVYTLLILISCGVLQTSPIHGQYLGGDGRGDMMNSLNGIVASKRILWTGLIDTSWSLAGNWYPQSVPLPTDSIAIERNGNGIEPYLDQHRSLHSIDFNDANKKVHTGLYNLTITNRLIDPNERNYIRTKNTGRLFLPLEEGEEKLFPCGNSRYNPVSIKNRTGQFDYYSARVGDTVYADGFYSGSIFTPHIRRTWYISNTAGTANVGQGVDLRFQWNNGEESGVVSSPYLYHYNGNGWENPPASQSTPWIDVSDSSTAFHFEGYKKSFSAFMLREGNNPLPVTLSHWQADCGEEQLVELTWITSSEINNDFFSVERSEDGTGFEPIAYLCGAGNSNQEISYFFKDSTSGGGAFYYRLRQTDYDNGTRVYRMIYISCGTHSGESFKVYPNPTPDQIHISGIQEKTTLLIQNIIGSPVKKVEVTPQSPTTYLKELGAGLYYLKISNQQKTETQKVIVQP